MRVFVTVLAALLFCDAAQACGSGPTSISWSGWTIQSSERLWTGRMHSSYPMTYLFDDNPRTAWVWSGQQEKRPTHEDKFWRSRYALLLRPSKPVEIDQVRIMNGYNRRADLFHRNNRVVELTVSRDGGMGSTWGCDSRLLKKANLKDSMGWHSVSLPRRRVESLMLSFTGIRRGRDNDVCISGIELWNRGRKIDMKMPAAVHYDSGSIDDGFIGKAPYGYAVEGLVDWRRNVAIADNNYLEDGLRWSPSGRFVCGVHENPKTGALDLWIADAQRAKVLRHLQVLDHPVAEFRDVRWLGRGRIAVDYHAINKSNRSARSRRITKTYQFS